MDAKIIDYTEVLKRQKALRNLEKFPNNILRDMHFNERFGMNLHYERLDPDCIKGIYAWLIATDTLAYWEELEHIPEWTKIISEYYIGELTLPIISARRKTELTYHNLEYWFEIMSAVGIKYGFPLWVKYGASHTITSDELIKLQSMYAKQCCKSWTNIEFNLNPTVENLFPIYCLNIKYDPRIDIDKQSDDSLKDYVNNCRVEIERNCIAYRDILKGDNWFTTDFHNEYFVAAPTEEGETVCTIDQRFKNGLEW